MRSTLTKLVTVAAVVAPLTLQAQPAVAPPALAQGAPRAAEIVLPRAVETVPRTQLLYNDPRHRPHALSDAITANIAQVPPGEEIEVTTYWISSHRIARALTAAVRRGVRVHLIMAGNDKARG